MKLSHAILAVCLDGKSHSEDEIIQRVRHLVPPEHAVRREAADRNSWLSRNRKARRNKTDKVLLHRRKPDVDPITLDPEESIKSYVRRILAEMVRQKHGYSFIVAAEQNGHGPEYVTAPDFKAKLRAHPNTTGGIASAIRTNLLIRGELL